MVIRRVVLLLFLLDHGLYNLEKVLNFSSCLEKSLKVSTLCKNIFGHEQHLTSVFSFLILNALSVPQMQLQVMCSHKVV